MCDKSGILSKNSEGLNWMQKSMMDVTNLEGKTGSLADALAGADVFVGVSAPNIVTADMVKTMNKDAIIFAMANPVPQIFLIRLIMLLHSLVYSRVHYRDVLHR